MYKALDLLAQLNQATLSPDTIKRIAFETGFCQRRSGKIKAPDFLIQLCLESLQGTVSFNDLAARLEQETGSSASRQAYAQRMGEPCLQFFQRILELVMQHAAAKGVDSLPDLPGNRFKRILIQDSTVIALPLRLFSDFSGVKNAHRAVCNARIQGVYDLLAGRFVKFSIDPYHRNDLSAALDLSLEPGDLILRDRGYFSCKAFEQQISRRADFIQRYKHKHNLYEHEHSEVSVDLLKLLRKKTFVDQEVWIGSTPRLKIRLVAFPVKEEVANLRRMKAQKEMKGHNPSEEVLALMSWCIFITTLCDPIITSEHIAELYRLRWRIENIFKTWKSHFSFDKIHSVSGHQLRVLLTARLIMITLIYQAYFTPLSRRIQRTFGRQLSLMKFTRYIRLNPEALHRFAQPHRLANEVLNPLVRFCTHDHRRRKNFAQRTEEILTRLDLLRLA